MSGGARSSERVLAVPGPSLPIQCLRGRLSLLGSLRTPSHPWAATKKEGVGSLGRPQNPHWNL